VAFAERFLAEHPDLNGRLHATGDLPAPDVATHLLACDLLVQPYPDGVSSRRGSFMAGMALGVPAVTTRGVATESLWNDRLAALSPAGDTDALVRAAEILLDDHDLRQQLGEQARVAYQMHFSIDHTLRLLREPRQGQT
jgi:glycosyltransferase involved in cell wall biosynthesis